MLTPLHLEILIHHAVCSEPFRADTETIRSYRQYWVETGCLLPAKDASGYCATEKGKAWLDKALSTPMPTQKWVWE